eukprot:gene12250-16423_t
MNNLVSNFSLATIKNSLDEVRAQVYPRNETERKVYDALSSKNWGASSTLLNDIASDEKYNIIVNLIWSNLEGEGKTWKHIFKTLTLLDFLIKNGAERIIEASRDKIYKIRTLQEYSYYEASVDKGSGVREKAKQICELLSSNDNIRSEREKARALRNKFVGIDSSNSMGGGYGGNSNYGGNSYGGNSGGYGGSSGSYGGNNGGYGGNSGSYGGDNGSYGGSKYDSNNDSNSKYGGDNSYSDSNTNRRGSATGSSNNNNRYDSDYSTNKYDDYNSKSTDKYDNDRSNTEDQDIFSPNKSKTTTEKTTGGKLKVNIKKSSTSSSTGTVSKPPVATVDLFGDSAPSVTTTKAQQQDLLFDAFDTPAAPVATTSSVSFDAFTAPVAPSAPAFDPFANNTNLFAPAPPVPVAAFDPFANSQPIQQSFPTQTNQQMFQGFQTAPPVPTINNNIQQQQFGQFTSAPIALNSAPLQSSNIIYQPSHPEADFGDFEAAPSSKLDQSSNQTAPASKWGDLGKLVDLSNIGKNEDLAAKQKASANSSTNYANNSFAGLDGFSKTPQNMANAARPTLSNSYPIQSNQPMMARTPVMGGGMMGAPPSVPMGGGYNNPMGMQGGYQTNMAPPPPIPGMGYNNMSMPPPNNMYGGAPGIPNGYPPMGGNVGMGMPPSYSPQPGMYGGGYPNQQMMGNNPAGGNMYGGFPSR